ncbi:MAG: TonB-dependent receptor [Deltaproteobacteria bacterium]|nr:TonB-dependent receptor [Deltaproteobacteria bacterium]
MREIRVRHTVAIVVALLAVVRSSPGVAEETGSRPLKALSVDELMQVEVTSVGKKAQHLAEAAAAVYVITQEDIRRSGATTLVEALRLVPGVHVGRMSADDWAVGIRGFSSRLSRSMLVLIDGRSVYTPLFAGVYWQVQDTLLEDVDRIEVIRGPGGTLWGANAVTGVVNIITKSAADTHGQLVVGGGGSEERAFGGARQGGVVGDDLHYRVYGKAFDRDGAFSRNTRDFDGWHMGQGGFRTDWTPPSGPDHVTLQGDYYDGAAGERAVRTTIDPPSIGVSIRDVDLSGGNVLGRWEHAFAGGSGAALQLYYDRTNRRDVNFLEDRDTFDLDFQHRVPLGVHEFIWGLGYRVSSGRAETIPSLVLAPSRRTNHLVSGFLQDEVVLLDDRLHLIAGSKLEWNDYSGVEVQPNVRALVIPAPGHVVWAAISRAVRTPSRVEQDLEADTLTDPSTRTFARLIGDGRFKSEKVLAYELGYRVQPQRDLSFDIATFYNAYQDLLSAELGTPFAEPAPSGTRTIIPVTLRNRLRGDVYGIELAVEATPTEWCRLSASYAYLEVELSPDPGSRDVIAHSEEGASPHNQVVLRSLLDLPYHLELDTTLRYVDNVPAQSVGDYVNADLRLGWHATPNLEISLVGQNLLEGHHAEFGSQGGVPLEIQRGVYGKAVWRW